MQDLGRRKHKNIILIISVYNNCFCELRMSLKYLHTVGSRSCPCSPPCCTAIFISLLIVQPHYYKPINPTRHKQIKSSTSSREQFPDFFLSQISVKTTLIYWWKLMVLLYMLVSFKGLCCQWKWQFSVLGLYSESHSVLIATVT